MATNTKRGLFRIWLVVTVLWLCPMLFLSGQEYLVALQRSHEYWEVVIRPPDYVLKDDGTKVATHFATPADGEAQSRADARDALMRGVLFAFGVPLILLALGAGAIWAFSGFKPKPGKPS